MKTISVANNKDGISCFVISFEYRPKIVDAIRKIPFRKFDKESKNWYVRIDHQVAKYIEVFSKYFDFILDEDATRELNKLKVEPSENDTMPILKKELRPFQKYGVSKAAKFERCLISDEMGLGKAQSINSKILTPYGWKKFKDIKINDEIINSSGTTSKVTGIYPQGIKDLYTVKFSDGASTITCDEHLWAVQTALQKHRGCQYKVKSLNEIKNDLIKPGKNRKNNKWFIPIVKPVQFAEIPVIIDPYILGLLLGDGGITSEVKFTASDTEIVESIKSNLPSCLTIKSCNNNDENIEYSIIKSNQKFKFGKNLYKSELRKLSLLGKHSDEKFIPDCYKFNSVNNRISILQGLLDTDGYVSKDGCCQYYTTSKLLCDDVAFIIQSLGGVARISSKIPKYTYKGETKIGKKCYIITLNLPSEISPFRLSRKLNNLKKIKKYNPCRAITSITYYGAEESMCISTSSEDHLYITDDCIVTHNTIESIVTIEKLQAYPCLVICPASIKLNWKKEIDSWVDRSISVINGLIDDTSEDFNYDADFVIINYDIVNRKAYKEHPITKDKIYFQSHSEKLSDINFKSVIFDESQMIKNPKAERSKAIKSIVKNIKYRFALSGTPILNRPKELICQLDMLDRLDSFGGFWSFTKKYCAAEETDFGWNFSGASNLNELHKKLIDTCMIRRLKSEVLSELPAKQRTNIPIEIDNKSDYNFAEKDFKKWVSRNLINPEQYKEQITAHKNLTESQKRLVLNAMIKSKVNQTLTAEALTKIEYLKQLSIEGKMSKIKDFITNALDQDVKLIVFSTHIKIQNELLKFYKDRNPASILSKYTTKVRQENVDKFQNDKSCRLMIASLEAAGVGITLTASSTVIFIEFGWNSAEHDQCEDRAHRFGQKDSVNCYYLYGKDTIDENILSLIEQKRNIINSAIDGKEEITAVNDISEIIGRFI